MATRAERKGKTLHPGWLMRELDLSMLQQLDDQTAGHIIRRIAARVACDDPDELGDGASMPTVTADIVADTIATGMLQNREVYEAVVESNREIASARGDKKRTVLDDIAEMPFP